MEFNDYPFFEGNTSLEKAAFFIDSVINIAMDLSNANIKFPIQSESLYFDLINSNWVNINNDELGSRAFRKNLSNVEIYYNQWQGVVNTLGISYPFSVLDSYAFSLARRREGYYPEALDEFYAAFNGLIEAIEARGYTKYFNYDEVVNKLLCGKYDYFYHNYYLVGNIVVGIMQYYDENYYAPAITVNFFSLRDNLKEDLLKWDTNYPLE